MNKMVKIYFSLRKRQNIHSTY